MSNTVYVVTGGGSGMGLAAASFLPDDSIILITGRTLPKLESAAEMLREKGKTVQCVACDTSDRESVRKLAETAATMGEVRGVINAAGVSGSMSDIPTILRINALGTVYVNQEFYKIMSEGSCILDVCSNSAYTLPGLLIPERLYPLAVRDDTAFVEKVSKRCKIGKDTEQHSQIAYCISKNFVKWYVKNCAYKYAKRGIRVVSVSPGFVYTDMVKKEMHNPATQVCIHYSGLERGAKPEELGFLMANVVDPRNSYLVGVDILCDGGSISAGFNGTVAAKPDSRPKITENW